MILVRKDTFFFVLFSWIEKNQKIKADPVEWRKDYFDETTGGYLVTSWKRLEEASKNHNEQQKFDKEHGICLVFVKSGLKIQHLEDNKPEGTYDVICNGHRGDLKRTKGSGNIVRYAKYPSWVLLCLG